MKSKKSLQKFKHSIRENGALDYNFSYEQRDPDKTWYIPTMYDQVLTFEEERVFFSDNISLEALIEEVKLRIKITQNEIFQIGELLCIAKKKCSVEKISFQQLINDNFDFSYETANNFMNVYKNCFGIKGLVYKIPVSILYTISKPNFPEELRQFLFDEGNLEKMTNGKLKKIIELYKEKGIEAVEPEIEKVNHITYTHRQSSYTFDIIENALRTLEDLKKKLINRGGSKFNGWIWEKGIENNTEEAREVNTRLLDSIEKSIEMMDSALKDSHTIINSLTEKM